MIIISDCLTYKMDEGCLKVANSLTKHIKQSVEQTTVISYDRRPNYSDVHLKLNKLFLDKKLFQILKHKNEPVLYIPFASNTVASCLRTFMLSVFTKRKCGVLFVLQHSMNAFSKALLKASRAKVISLSEKSYKFYKDIVAEQAIYIKTGVDINRFIPVTETEKQILKKKYAIPEDKKIVLHVGHLKSGRNVDKLAYIDEQYHVILAVSTVTMNESDFAIRKLLEQRGNITIIDSYVENIEEIYQIADVYLFPVIEAENCIDVPLSVLEAASCNLPIIATEYGELTAFKGEEGFIFINELSPSSLNSAISKLIELGDVDNRSVVNEYDWKNSITTLQTIL